MNFSELQTQVSNKIGYGDQASKIPTYINSAIHELEKEENWLHMESVATGNFTSSVDYFAKPTRYKNSSLLSLENDTFLIFPQKVSYEQMLKAHPCGSNSKGLPKAYSLKAGENRIYVRPYPDKTYPYEFVYNAFSADLSADTDTNYWTESAWEIVMYGALIQFELDSGEQLKLGTEESPLSPVILYERLLAKMKRNLINEKTAGGIIYSRASYVH